MSGCNCTGYCHTHGHCPNDNGQLFRISEEDILRKLMFVQHSHGGESQTYHDDGEMQCVLCHCDFVRDSASTLQEKIEAYNLEQMRKVS
jgi:hypothetical protein